MPIVSDIQVSQALYERATAIRRIGGKAFLAIEDATSEDPTAPECPHCHGSGYQYLQYVTGGPYNVATGFKGATMIHEGDKWYTVETGAYDCPTCKRESARL